MAELTTTIADDLCRYLDHLAARVDKAARSVPVAKFYTRPYPNYGNSIGHLVLHLTGNLNHYIGAGIAQTGYVRDRPREFTDANPPPPDGALEDFHKAVAMVARTIRSLNAASLQTPMEGLPPVRSVFGQILVCVSHINNHVGQMAYLVRELGHDTNEPPSW